jgi:hypothetical protein
MRNVGGLRIGFTDLLVYTQAVIYAKIEVQVLSTSQSKRTQPTDTELGYRSY